MRVTIHAAKTNLSKLIDAALSGEEVVISKGQRPVVRLTPIPQNSFQLGILKDKVSAGGPDFFEPMDQDDLADWEGAN